MTRITHSRYKQKDMKYTPIIISIALIIFCLLTFGCSSTQPKGDIEYHDLLHKYENYARKSATIDDYIIKEDC